MNARTIRRAIERKARKQAQKEAARTLSTAPGPLAGDDAFEQEALEETRTISEAQLTANRRNATRSTGPVTAEGKSRSSRNALKTGLTGRTVLLASEDAALYELHLQQFRDELRPSGERETELVQAIADSLWRLRRIPSLELGIYALGRRQFAEQFQNVDPAEAAALIEVQTFLTYQKQLSNLSIQESRLRRQYEKDWAELKDLQERRLQAERAAARKAQPAKVRPEENQLEENGFEFSTAGLSALENHFGLHTDLLTLPEAA